MNVAVPDARGDACPAVPDHADAAVIIPCIEVEKLTLRCVEECRRLFPQAQIIVLADDPKGSELISGRADVVITGPITISAKRNRGARATSRPVVAFIDSDAYPAPAWLDHSVRALRDHPEIGAVAGPNVSPPDQTRSERYVGIALRSDFCAHNAHYIKRPAPARLVDNMPSSNFIMRRDEYLAMDGMDESLYIGEDVELCSRLAARNRKILYLPTVLVYHKNRAFRQFVLQRLVYGGLTVEVLLKHPNAKFIITMIPAAMLVFLLTGLALPWLPWWAWIYVPVVGLYSGFAIVESIRHSPRLSDMPGALGAFVAATLVPGVGAIAKILGGLPSLRRLYRNDR